MTKRTGEWMRVVTVGVGATIVLSCAPVTMDMVGDAMVDAGHALLEGGRDLTDAADGMTADANAQPSCATSCTTSGVQRVVTAETDIDRLDRGTARAFTGLTDTVGAYYGELVVGPAVVTYARHVGGFGGSNASATFYLSNAASCDIPTADRDASLVGRTYDTFTGGPWSSPALTGGLVVRAGERLCFVASSGTAASWTGYRPYD